MIKPKKNDLFEDLREETGALYISDLCHSPYHERAIQILSQMCGGGTRFQIETKHWNICCFMKSVLLS